MGRKTMDWNGSWALPEEPIGPPVVVAVTYRNHLYGRWDWTVGAAWVVFWLVVAALVLPALLTVPFDRALQRRERRCLRSHESWSDYDWR
jgi:hypothetical protein